MFSVSGIAIKSDLVALLNLSSWCLVMVERLFLAVPWSCLRFVIVIYPDHTHLLILKFSIRNVAAKKVIDLSLVLKDSDMDSENLSSLIWFSLSDGQKTDSSKLLVNTYK